MLQREVTCTNRRVDRNLFVARAKLALFIVANVLLIFGLAMESHTSPSKAPVTLERPSDANTVERPSDANTGVIWLTTPAGASWLANGFTQDVGRNLTVHADLYKTVSIGGERVELVGAKWTCTRELGATEPLTICTSQK